MTTRILAIVDPEREDQTALRRCSELPADADIAIHIAFFLPIASAEKLAHHDYANPKKKRELMDKMIEDYGLQNRNFTSEVVPFDRLYESIIRTARQCDADYIFKPLRKHNLVKRSLFTSTDWNLIRMCPIPILLVSQAESVVGKPVIAALDIGSKDDSHKELNRIVLSQAQVVARVVNSGVHAINACTFPSAAWGYSATDPAPYESARAQLTENLAQLVEISKEFGISKEYVAVREGTPSLVINTYSDEVKAGIAVLGTIARSGLAGLFIGNTAESVLENCITDILVVKHADFQSPIKDH
ncbi:MAG: universal stress protein [Gammaproteobacteria bacterium]|nr:universal stress protein [Gammaproteobacteria bacterium]